MKVCNYDFYNVCVYMNMCLFCSTHLPVTGAFRTGVVHTDDNKDVLEV